MHHTFLTNLSRDLSKLLADADDYNIIIYVGEDSSAKQFKAHTNLLRARSPYFRTALSSDWVVKEDGIIVFKKPNISPVVFEIILKYIYSGDIALEEYDATDILALLVAADELILEELVAHVQHHLIHNKPSWLHENFVQVMHTVFRLQACKTFQDHCIDAICSDPQSFFTSDEFTTIEEDILLALLKRNDLEMDEVDIWNHVLRWGIAQTPTIENSAGHWTPEEFEALEKKLHECIPLLRFFEMSPSEFYDHVRPFKPLLPIELYEDLVRSHYKPQLPRQCVVLPPRSPRIDSTIISSKHVTMISHWIEGGSGKPPTYHKPRFQFKLLYRGTRDGFTPRAFRNKCSNQGQNVVLLKIQGTGKIIGGYNPIGWCNRADYAETKKSFIFSIDDNNNENGTSTMEKLNSDERSIRGFPVSEEPKLSRVSISMSTSAIFDLESYGPNFGKGDLVIYENCKTGSCRKYTYEHEIMDPGDFVSEEFEVFKIVEK
ncbi:732_t:CDS:2 [Ambispora leptoticha]|uniref:732_t:CDS:1 n=1 Tax=Ambispora leptoticha TaxID=144679 RepID=A0A9N9C2J0_9GLOM|nr:732_t:CDS:2 [Ambispora leptoticha]